MRQARMENVILQADDGHRRTAGSVVIRGGQVWLKAWINLATHGRHDSNAIGVNDAILRYLDDCGIKQVYLLDTASRRIFGATTQELRRLGSRHRHRERVKGGAIRDWGWNWNLPLERWKKLPGFDLGYVPAGAEWVVEATGQPGWDDEPAESTAKDTRNISLQEGLSFGGHTTPAKVQASEPAQLGLFDDARVA